MKTTIALIILVLFSCADKGIDGGLHENHLISVHNGTEYTLKNLSIFEMTIEDLKPGAVSKNYAIPDTPLAKENPWLKFNANDVNFLGILQVDTTQANTNAKIEIKNLHFGTYPAVLFSLKSN